MRCPFCAEEIQPGAAKCKHCGEWLDRSRAPVSPSTSVQADHLDNSKINFYTVSLKTPGQRPRYSTLSGENESQVRDFITKKYGGCYIDEKYGFQLKPPGKYTCPNCRSKYTKCERAIGCAVLIIIFISLGLGLIMVPFLPSHCECELCGYKWKA